MNRYESKIAYAWLPMSTTYGESIWLCEYIEVTMDDGLVLTEIYDGLGEEAQAMYIVSQHEKRRDEITEDV